MRLEFHLSQDAIDIAARNGIDQAAPLRFVGQFVAGPGGHRTVAVLQRFAGDVGQAPHLLGSELSRSAASQSVAGAIDDRPLQGGPAFAELYLQERFIRVSPAPPPQADRRASAPSSRPIA